MGMIELIRSIIANEPHLETDSGSSLAFFADRVAKLKSCTVNFEPVQNGTGDPNPVDNVRPISGFDGVTVTHNGTDYSLRFGNNLFDELYVGITNSGSTVTYRPIYVGNITVTMSTTTERSSNASALFLLPGNVSSGASTSSNGVWNGQNRTVAAVDGYVTIGYRYGWSYGTTSPLLAETMLNEGTTAKPYEPFMSIYKGYVDVVTGTFCATHKLKTFIGTSVESWTQDSARYYISLPDAKTDAVYTRKEVVSNIGVFRSSGANLYTVFAYEYGEGNKRLYYYPPDSITTVSAFKEWLMTNNLQVLYELAEPITYQLSAQQIKTVCGTNNISSNSNCDIDVQYWTHEGGTISDMIQTCTINSEPTTLTGLYDAIQTAIGSTKTRWIAWSDDPEFVYASGNNHAVVIVGCPNDNQKAIYRNDSNYEYMRRGAYGGTLGLSTPVGTKYSYIVMPEQSI